MMVEYCNQKASALLLVGLLLSVLSYLTLRRPGTALRPYDRLGIFLETCSTGNVEKVRGYLERQPDFLDALDSEGWSCLINASKHNRVGLVQALLEMGASTGTKSMRHSALRGAAMFGYVEVVQLLLDAGAIVDVYSTFNRTPLMGAAMNGHAEVVSMLLTAGADRTLRNDDGQTAMDLAEQHGHQGIVRLLRNEADRDDDRPIPPQDLDAEP